MKIFLKKACGGTTLNYNGTSITSFTEYISEAAWSGSGGGFSSYFKRPAYQNGLQNNQFRGVPDISAHANVENGYYICYTAACKSVGGI